MSEQTEPTEPTPPIQSLTTFTNTFETNTDFADGVASVSFYQHFLFTYIQSYASYNYNHVCLVVLTNQLASLL